MALNSITRDEETDARLESARRFGRTSWRLCSVGAVESRGRGGSRRVGLLAAFGTGRGRRESEPVGRERKRGEEEAGGGEIGVYGTRNGSGVHGCRNSRTKERWLLEIEESC